MQWQAIHFNTSLARNVLPDEYLAGGDDEDDDTETSHTVLAYSYELLAQRHSHTYSTDKIITGMAQRLFNAH